MRISSVKDNTLCQICMGTGVVEFILSKVGSHTVYCKCSHGDNRMMNSGKENSGNENSKY